MEYKEELTIIYIYIDATKGDPREVFVFARGCVVCSVLCPFALIQLFTIVARGRSRFLGITFLKGGQPMFLEPGNGMRPRFGLFHDGLEMEIALGIFQAKVAVHGQHADIKGIEFKLFAQQGSEDIGDVSHAVQEPYG